MCLHVLHKDIKIHLSANSLYIHVPAMPMHAVVKYIFISPQQASTVIFVLVKAMFSHMAGWLAMWLYGLTCLSMQLERNSVYIAI